ASPSSLQRTAVAAGSAYRPLTRCMNAARIVSPDGNLLAGATSSVDVSPEARMPGSARYNATARPPDEPELLARAIDKTKRASRAIIQRYNRRHYRLARSVLRDDGEAEDVLQDAYLRAFTALPGFRGEASLGTWLSRIVLNEALARLRRRRPTVALAAAEQ